MRGIAPRTSHHCFCVGVAATDVCGIRGIRIGEQWRGAFGVDSWEAGPSAPKASAQGHQVACGETMADPLSDWRPALLNGQRPGICPLAPPIRAAGVNRLGWWWSGAAGSVIHSSEYLSASLQVFGRTAGMAADQNGRRAKSREGASGCCCQLIRRMRRSQMWSPINALSDEAHLVRTRLKARNQFRPACSPLTRSWL
jgi:hypothetical protein